MAIIFYTGQPGPLAVQRLNELWNLVLDISGGGAAAWGGIVGDLASQADLVGVLAAKQDASTLGEAIDDRVGTLLAAGANITLTYNDAGNVLTIASTGALNNPMTAVGDLITGGAVVGGSAAPIRLAKGVDGQVLKMAGGVLAWGAPTQWLPIACSDEKTALSTGAAKVTFRMPFAMTGVTVRASVTTAPTGSVLTVDVNENGASILSTKLTIDAGEKTSTTAAVPAVLSDTVLADDAEITIDIDAIGSTVAGKGLKVYLIGTPT